MANFLELALKFTLVVFMIGNLLDMGLKLQLSEAVRGLRDGRFVFWGLLWGFVLVPGIAFGITKIVPLEAPYAMGLILLGMTPCAPFLPPMVQRAKGDMGYTAAFMLLVSVVTVIYMPLMVPVLVKGLSASAWTIAKPLVLFLLVPFALGLAIQTRSAPLTSRIEPFINKATGIDTIAMLLLCVVIYGKRFLALEGTYAIGAELIFFALATLAPCAFSFGLRRDQRVVLSLGMATRNLGAAFAPLFSLRDVDQRAIVTVALGVVMQAAFSFAAATFYGRGGERAKGRAYATGGGG